MACSTSRNDTQATPWLRLGSGSFLCSRFSSLLQSLRANILCAGIGYFWTNKKFPYLLPQLRFYGKRYKRLVNLQAFSPGSSCSHPFQPPLFLPTVLLEGSRGEYMVVFGGPTLSTGRQQSWLGVTPCHCL